MQVLSLGFGKKYMLLAETFLNFMKGNAYFFVQNKRQISRGVKVFLCIIFNANLDFFHLRISYLKLFHSEIWQILLQLFYSTELNIRHFQSNSSLCAHTYVIAWLCYCKRCQVTCTFYGMIITTSSTSSHTMTKPQGFWCSFSC